LEEAKLQIRLFGRFEVWRDGALIHPTEWGRRKTQSLFKLLLTEPKRVFTTEQLLEALYPKGDPERSAANLRTRISQLRRVLEPRLKQGKDSYYILRVSPAHYGFNDRAPYWLDAQEFENHRRAALKLQERNLWSQALEHFEQAIQLYRGDYLADDLYEEWTLMPRERFREQYLTAREGLAECYAHLGLYAHAIEQCQRAIQEKPVREHAYRQLMRYHHDAGRPDKVAQVYEACLRALQEHLDVEPTIETRKLYERLRKHPVTWIIEKASTDGQEGAHPQLQQSLVSHRDLGEPLTMAYVLQAMGTVAFREGSCVAARSLLEKSLKILQELGERRGIALLLEQYGWLEALEHPHRAARLFGAVEASLEKLRMCLPASMWADHEKSVALVCSQLDELTLAAAWAEGRAMTVEEAVRYALGEVIPC